MKQNFLIDLKGVTETEIEDELRASLRRFEKHPSFMTRRFWVGAMFGAIMIASMDYGDVHLCIGQCDGVGATRVVAP